MAVIDSYVRNATGQDYAVGDIHGHFTRLQETLDRIGFDVARDRLFSVGDLVDRGPESELALEWLNLPWFHAIQGNHEDVAIRYARGNPVDADTYRRNGGGWFLALDSMRQQEFAQAFAALPYAIEVDTQEGVVGLVHANCPFESWAQLRKALFARRSLRTRCMWDRRRIEFQDMRRVAGIRAVIVGHTPLKAPVTLGNVYHIDTGGWLPDEAGYFTLIDLGSLQTYGLIRDGSEHRA